MKRPIMACALWIVQGLQAPFAGSATLVQSLMQDDLIDEYRMMVHSVVVGSGKRLFKEGGDLKALKLVDSKTFSTGLGSLTYQPDRNEPK